jgi:hypothetical protein
LGSFHGNMLTSAFGASIAASMATAYGCAGMSSGRISTASGNCARNHAYSDGLHERVRCKATYVAEKAGHIVKLDLRGASDAYKFELSSSIMQTGDSLSGNWFESTHRVGGSTSGRNTGNEINARAKVLHSLRKHGRLI